MKKLCSNDTYDSVNSLKIKKIQDGNPESFSCEKTQKNETPESSLILSHTNIFSKQQMLQVGYA